MTDAAGPLSRNLLLQVGRSWFPHILFAVSYGFDGRPPSCPHSFVPFTAGRFKQLGSCLTIERVFLSRSSSVFCLHDFLIVTLFLAAAGPQREKSSFLVHFFKGGYKMERWSPSIVARAHLNMTLNTTLSTLEASWSQSNRTRMLIDNLRLAQVHTLRTMHVTLGAFSLGLALLMVLQILRDARRVSSLQVMLRPR